MKIHMDKHLIGFLLAIFFSILYIAANASYAANATEKTCKNVRYPAPSGQKNDIVFNFDKSYACGQFSNGDWWVSADASGFITITSVSPVFERAMHGMEVNPVLKNKHGFDKRISGYEDSLNPRLPLRVKGGASVVKAVSVSADQPKCRPCLQYAAVLTIVSSVVDDSETFLRPAYFGAKKTIYPVPADVLTQLSKFSVRCCSEAKYGDFERIARRYQGVQLDHIEGWVGGYIHPVDNMPEYGASIAVDNASSVLRFLLNDFDVQQQAHRSALVNYLQMGVDLEAMALDRMKWPGAGGHGNGRKLPILFAARLLGQGNFLQAAKRAVFSEDEQVYFSDKAGKALYGAPCSDSDYWLPTRFGRGARDCRDPYGYIDGGGHEIGDGYQFCCTAMPWKYTALAVRMLGLEQEWANNAFLEYADRWVNDGVWADPDPCAPYKNNPDDYMKVYGPDKDKNCIRGAGRYKGKHGTKKDSGYYQNKFADQMWRIYRKNIGRVGP